MKVSTEDIIAAAQKAAGTFRRRYRASNADSADLVQEGILALLACRAKLQDAESGAYLQTIAFRAMARRVLPPKKQLPRPLVQSDTLTPELLLTQRQLLATVKHVVEGTRLKKKKHVGIALLVGENPVTVAKKAGVTTGYAHNKAWLLRRALARNERVREQLTP